MLLGVVIGGEVEVVGLIPSFSLGLGRLHLAHLGSCQSLLVTGLLARLKEDGRLQLATTLTLFFIDSLAIAGHIEPNSSLLLLSASVAANIARTPFHPHTVLRIRPHFAAHRLLRKGVSQLKA
jgi:hypothetical protein